MGWRNLGLVCVAVAALSFPLYGGSLSQLKRRLHQGLRYQQKPKVVQAVKELVSYGGKKAMAILLHTAKKFRGDDQLYWILLHGVASFEDEEAMEELAKFLIRHRKKGISRDCLLALSQNHSEATLVVHREVLRKGTYDLKLLSVDQLAEIHVLRSVDLLLECWKKVRKDKKALTLRRRIVSALEVLTGERLGELYENWESYWQANRSRGLERKAGSSKARTVVRFGAHRGTGLRSLRKLPKKSIVVITGSPCKKTGAIHNFDQIEDTLARMEIPHTVVTKEEFNKGYSLENVLVIFLNCTLWWQHCVCPKCQAGGVTMQRLQQCTGCDRHIFEEDKLSQESVQRIKSFVERGGYLFTEDWGLVELLERAWPKMVRKGGSTNGEWEVNILPSRYQGSHPLLRGIFSYKKPEELSSSGGMKGKTVLRRLDRALEKVKHSWKVDSESPLIQPKSPLVQVLLVSPELKKHTKKSSVVAVTFLVAGRGRKPTTGRRYYGEVSEMRGGRVLHVISHFGKQKSDGDEYTLENLLVNFLLEVKERHGMRSRGS